MIKKWLILFSTCTLIIITIWILLTMVLYDCYDLDYVERAQADADRIHAELDFVPGSNILPEKLVSGRWDNQFLIVQPNMTITQGTFFDC